MKSCLLHAFLIGTGLWSGLILYAKEDEIVLFLYGKNSELIVTDDFTSPIR